MTREEAIKLIEHISIAFVPTDQYGDYDDPQPYEEALDMAIEALQNLSKPNNGLQGSDLISRQDAIDAWWHDEVFFGNQRDDMTKEQWLDYITDAIGSLPSAQTEKPKIIMCKNCKYYKSKQGGLPWDNSRRYCNRSVTIATNPNDFCSYGERVRNHE